MTRAQINALGFSVLAVIAARIDNGSGTAHFTADEHDAIERLIVAGGVVHIGDQKVKASIGKIEVNRMIPDPIVTP